ncbi:hypothetical protein [Bradyrhizobium murdochi]|uniref:hypothetical protein n=1 Tax=Bradyrhizobium murdochi TaxID=1038859 RepID=UPI0004812ACA|nr:hypothetical protein [Bradyrhizobium murdochi]
MSAQFGAWFAAVGSAGGCHSIFKSAIRGAVVALAIGAAGCTPATTRLASADPADPAARVASVRYRSTIAPYTSLRPSTPAPWRERNESVTPKQRGNSHAH